MATVGKRSLNDVLKKPKKSKPDPRQLTLDFGQKTFQQCTTCGMLYTCGLEEQEHYKFHTRSNEIPFPGWKNERVVERFSLDRIILVLPSDSKRHLKKVSEILTVIDTELGTSTNNFSDEMKSFLYISNHKAIGFVHVQAITKGYRIISSEDSGWYCSEEAEPALMGVNRVWVCHAHRRKGIATKLLDAARSHFMFGNVVPVQSVAFTEPTLDGRKFIINYCKKTDFLVYF